MKKILIIIILAILAGCTVQKSSTILFMDKRKDCSMKQFQQTDSMYKENRFTKDFQRADSMFNQKYGLQK